MNTSTKRVYKHNKDQFEHMDPQDYDEWYYTRPAAIRYDNNPAMWENLTDLVCWYRPTNVYEFGAGLGHTAKRIHERGIKLVAEEYSDYAVANGVAEQGVVTKGQLIPPGSIEYPDKQFDLVFSNGVMEHVPEQDVPAVFTELYRICSKHAFIIINLHDPHQPGHITMKPREWWDEAFKKAGFKQDQEAKNALDTMKQTPWDLFTLSR